MFLRTRKWITHLCPPSLRLFVWSFTSVVEKTWSVGSLKTEDPAVLISSQNTPPPPLAILIVSFIRECSLQKTNDAHNPAGPLFLIQQLEMTLILISFDFLEKFT